MDSLQFYPNPTKSMTVDKLIELVWTFSYVRAPFQDRHKDQAADFEEELKSLVQSHHGDAPFDLPWVCKAYTLRPKI